MKNHILIVGAGLCGTLLAIRMAQRGYRVSLHEKRPDMRSTDIAAGRSINLALSNRGLKALRLAGLEKDIIKECIPMNGRMLHFETGELRLSKYSGREGEYINSVSRGGLNISLINKAEAMDNINIVFNSNCLSVDLEKASAVFQDADTKKKTEVNADIVIGTDGAGSAVRRSLMARTTQLLFNYSQDFLRHGYKELSIPPTEDGRYRIEKNALHIWPRGTYMIIALPNLDGSFTVTMFNPYDGENGFNALDTKPKVQAFFEEKFADILPHAPTLLEDYFANPTGNLGTIKCYPWQAFGKTLIMGDAAHAIVPFYGQGMNASFEDIVVFDEVLDQHEGNWEKVFTTFQDIRAKDTNAIADLAVDNFYEMRDGVTNPDFIKKRSLEMQLEQNFPEYYSKYSLVTFNENLSYSQAKEKGRKQDEFLLDFCANNPIENIDLKEVFQMIKKELS